MAFIQIPIEDLDVLDKLSKNSLKLYLRLRQSLNRKSGQCNPTPESLGWEESKYYRARKELELLGLVKFNGKRATFKATCQACESPILQNGEMAKLQVKTWENSKSLHIMNHMKLIIRI